MGNRIEWSDDIRFILDEDNDIVDNVKMKVYNFNLQKDWEKLLILLNTLSNQKNNIKKEHDEWVEIIKEEYDEFNNYIDEYSMIKIDILLDLAGKLGIDLD